MYACFLYTQVQLRQSALYVCLICMPYVHVFCTHRCNFDNLSTLVAVTHCLLPLLAIPLTFVLIPNKLMTDKIVEVCERASVCMCMRVHVCVRAYVLLSVSVCVCARCGVDMCVRQWQQVPT